VSEKQKQEMREEFATVMHQSFLDGCDVDFDYGQVDGDASLDDLDILDRDEEERYFDTDD
jgi:hypothetical protein